MKIGGPPPPPDPGRRLQDQGYGIKPGRQTLASGAALNLGLLLKGKVVAVETPGGLLTVQTDRGLFTATAAGTALTVGREFWFQVVQAGSSPLLAAAGKANAVFDLLRVLLPEMLASGPLPAEGEQAALPAAASQLTRLLSEGQVDAHPDPLKLARQISQLGLGQGDQPGLAAELAKAPDRPLDALPPAVQKLYRVIEAHAQLNQQPPASGSPDYCLFPVFFAEQSGRGEWLYAFEQEAEDDNGQGTEGAASLSFYLAMSRLGDVHLALTMRPGRLTGTFTLPSPEAADHVRRNLPELQAALEPLCGTVNIASRTAPCDCVKLLKDELSAKAGMAHFALVDISA